LLLYIIHSNGRSTANWCNWENFEYQWYRFTFSNIKSDGLGILL